MIIHLTGSSRDSREDLPYLRKIIDVLHNEGHQVAHNWVETSNNTVKNDPNKAWDWHAIVAANQDAANSCNLVIIEATSYAFFQGYQLAQALDQFKPVLVVSRNPLDDLAISGIDNALLTLAEYSNERELEEAVQKFIHDFTPKKLELEVKIASNSKLQRYLEGQAERMGKTEDQILLDLATIGLKVRD